jgi:hypothetical protein
VLCAATSEFRIKAFQELLASTRTDDGTFLKPLSDEVRPHDNVDHQRGMNYTSLGGSAGGRIYQTAADIIRFVRENSTWPETLAWTIDAVETLP